MLRRDGQAKQTSAQTGAFVTSVDIIGIFVMYNNITARKIVQNLNPRSEKIKKLRKVLWRLFCLITATYNSLWYLSSRLYWPQVLCHASLRLLRLPESSIYIVLTNKETITYTCFKFLIRKKFLRNKMKNKGLEKNSWIF